MEANLYTYVVCNCNKNLNLNITSCVLVYDYIDNTIFLQLYAWCMEITIAFIQKEQNEASAAYTTFYTTPAPAKAPALLSSPASAYPMDTIASISTPEPVSTWGVIDIPGM